MNPLILILFFVSCSRINCSESEIFSRGDISSLDQNVRIQSSSNSAGNFSRHDTFNHRASELAIPPRIDVSSLNVSQTNFIGIPRNDPNDLVSLHSLVSIRGTDSDSSSDDEDDILDYELNLFELESIANREVLPLNKDGSTRKRNRVDYKRCAKKIKHLDPEGTNVWMQMINDPNVRDPSSRQV